MPPENRLTQKAKFKISRPEALALAALLALIVSYGLGYRLDWGERPVGQEFSAQEEADGEEASGGLPQGLATGLPRATGWGTDPSSVAWESMTEELTRLAATHRGRVAILLRDLVTGRTWTYHPDDLFPSASLIKLPVMACVFSAIHDGRLSLNDRLRLRRRHRTGGSGSIKWRRDGTELTVKELLYRMIGESDNTAAAMLIESLGYGYIQQQFARLGLFYTEITPEGMSLRGGRVAQENYTTAREMDMLLGKIYGGELIDKPSSELMMDILRHRRAATSRLAKGLPRGWEIAHKTGLLRLACHDSAVIFHPNGAYSLTVLTGSNHNYRAAKEFISRVGRVTYRYYRGDQLVAQAGVPRQVAIR